MAACCQKIFSSVFSKKIFLINFPRALTQSRTISTTSQGAAAAQASNVSPIIKDPEAEVLRHHDYFKVRELVTLEDLFQARCHFGHKVGCRNPLMVPYLFGTRIDTDIIDLEQTVPLLQEALNFVAHVVYRKGIVLFVSRRKESMPWIEKLAKDCKEYAHCRFWNHASFLDTQSVVGQSVRLPDVVIFINTQNSIFQMHRAVVDSSKLLIPTVGIVDSDCDPRLLSYPVPGNDDSNVSIKYYLKLFEETIMRAKKQRELDDANFKQNLNSELM